MNNPPASPRTAARLCHAILALHVSLFTVACDGDGEPAETATATPAAAPAHPALAATASSPSTTAPVMAATASNVDRGSPRTAAESLLAALRRRDAVALARVVAPGKDGTADQRAAQTLAGKGKLRSLEAALRAGSVLAPGVEVASRPEDGRQVVKVTLDLTDPDGVTHAAAAALEVFKFDDGWRVDDFDRTGGNWPR